MCVPRERPLPDEEDDGNTDDEMLDMEAAIIETEIEALQVAVS